ncbi:DUF4141 domain-containing protein [Phocaeicola vulgatus]|nr:DUF4141 domain-containing protein [Phocaeicola vulgatus]
MSLHCVTAGAQWVVTDPGNTAQGIINAANTASTVKQTVEQVNRLQDRPGLCPEGVRHRQTRTDVHGPDRPAEPVEQQLPQDAGRGGEDGHEGAAGHHFGRAGRGGEQRRHHLPDRGYTQQ